MKTFTEISQHCPFGYDKKETQVCIARCNFQNPKLEVIACNIENCAVYYIAKCLVLNEQEKEMRGRVYV
jgi:hypothetical protein